MCDLCRQLGNVLKQVEEQHYEQTLFFWYFGTACLLYESKSFIKTIFPALCIFDTTQNFKRCILFENEAKKEVFSELQQRRTDAIGNAPPPIGNGIFDCDILTTYLQFQYSYSSIYPDQIVY